MKIKNLFLGTSLLLLGSIANTQVSYDSLRKEYTNGKLHDNELLQELALKAKERDEVFAKQLADKIINDLAEDSLYVKRNLHFIYDFTKKSTDRGFAIFKDHADKVEQSSPILTRKMHSASVVASIIFAEEIKPYITSLNSQPDWERIQANLKKYDKLGSEILSTQKNNIIILSAIQPYVKSRNGQPDWNIIKNNLRAYGKRGDEHFLLEQILFFANNKNWTDLTKTGKTFFQQFPNSDLIGTTGNNIAWMMFNNCDHTEALQVALEFAKQATLADKQQPAYRDTYANILYKLGRVKEAIKNQEIALQLYDGGDIRANYEKMKVGVKTWKKDE